VALVPILELRGIAFGGFIVGASADTHFRRVDKVVDNIGNVFILDVVGGRRRSGNAIYLRQVGAGILRRRFDVDCGLGLRS